MNSGRLNVSVIRGLSPNFRVTLNEDSTLEMESDIRVNNQSYFPFSTGTTDQRPGDVSVGTLRYNTDYSRWEFFQGSLGWKLL